MSRSYTCLKHPSGPINPAQRPGQISSSLLKRVFPTILGLGVICNATHGAWARPITNHSGAKLSPSLPLVLRTKPSANPHTATPWVPLVPNKTASFSIASTPITALENQVLQEINLIRRQHHLSPLRRHQGLVRVARRHSQNMLKRHFFSHTDPAGDSAYERVQKARISFQLVAENLAWNMNSPDPVARAVRGWMESTGHRRNILEPRLRKTGVGIARRGQEYYFTQVFIRQH